MSDAAIPSKLIEIESYLSRASASLRAGRTEDAVAVLAKVLAGQPAEQKAWHLLAVAETLRQRHEVAYSAIRRALVISPNNSQYQRQLGLVLFNLKRFDEAIGVLLPVLRNSPDDRLTIRALQIAYARTGKESHAVALGRKLLRAEETNVLKIARESPSADIMPFARGGDRVISFSLQDVNPAATIGAVANAKLAQSVYPGWKCRFYVGQSTSARIKAVLAENGAEIVEAWAQYPDIPPALWPYLAADDPGVAAFVCRNSSARISPKEAAAVDAWLLSGKHAHVMRDHVLHRNLVLPGLWGARTDNPLFVSARIERFMTAYANPPYGREQRFLDSEIWPAIRDDCLIHDSYYSLFDAQPFPAMGKGNDRFHVGMGITGMDALRREAQLLGLSWLISKP